MCVLSLHADIEVLHEREDWQVQSEEGGVVTSLPVLFENVVVETLLSLKEIVIVKLGDDKEASKAAGEVDSRDNNELRDNTVGHFQGLWDVRIITILLSSSTHIWFFICTTCIRVMLFFYFQHLLGAFDVLAFHWEEEVHQELVIAL